ncbi:MAG TPA: LytR C-terminal domain-containing protein [Ilumatobacteraceae bacterium]|nr:LytR C-terminal domain-containing protein [Ilumatobacteraceae bacterium]
MAPTTTTIPLVIEGGVLKVANASGIDGAAKRLTDELGGLGFHTSAPTNAAGIEVDLAASKIYVMPGSEPVAFSISQVMQNLPVLYMPTPVSIKGGPEALGDATIVIMLGADWAGKSLTG